MRIICAYLYDLGYFSKCRPKMQRQRQRHQRNTQAKSHAPWPWSVRNRPYQAPADTASNVPQTKRQYQVPARS